jgi:phage shock protein A
MAAAAMAETTEIRVARLESDVAHIRSDVAELKVDVRELRKEIGGIHEKIGGLRDEMHKGFATLKHENSQTRIWMLLIGGAILGVLAHAVHWL